MENLIRSFTMIVLLTGLTISVSGQSLDAAMADFKKSYEYEFQGNNAQAIEVLKKSYQEDSYEYNARLGWLSYMGGNFLESIAFYEKAIALKPYAVEPRFGIVYPLSALGNWTTISEHYKKILEIDAMNTTANYRLGYLFYQKGDYESASKHFEKVVNLYPFDHDSVLMFAWSSYYLGKLREAKILFQKALMIKPDDESAKQGLQLIQ